MSKKKLFKISAACAGLLMGLGVISTTEAVKIKGPDGEAIKNCGGACYYLAAYEYYGNQQVIAGNTTQENPINVSFVLGKNYSTNETVSIKLTGAKFLAPNVIDTDATKYCLFNATPDILAIQSPHWTPSFPTDTIYLEFNTNVNSGAELILGVCNDTSSVETKDLMLQIDPNLGASCDKEVGINIKWAAPNDCCEGTLIMIGPKSVVETVLSFNAELDADRDFKTFLGGNTILNTCCQAGMPGCGACAPTGECTYKPEVPPAKACPEVYVLGENFDPSTGNIVKIGFDIISLYPEPGVDKIREYNTNATCSKIDDTYWRCDFDCIPCPTCGDGKKFLEVVLKGTIENNPTFWLINNVSITDICPVDPKVKDLCCGLKEGYVGAWWGGLEAIVPFVKHNPAGGYYTTIKFINRYKRPVKIYAQPFKNAPEPMMIATTYVKEVPANGGVAMITGAELQSLFGLSDTEMNNGMAFKFLLRVPSQAGCASIVKDGSICPYNPNDPYVEGIVVSDSPQGQRTVPLKFKLWKNGMYNQ
ncbi:MAG: hypothetical protein ABIN23_06930 [candidate division WOR-3 bacterium]